jgi:pimeloyl-ACP methyl ester carboxylesterase
MIRSRCFSAVCFLGIIFAVITCFPGISFSFALPDTGQTLCYDSDGNVIDCAGTGQDGEYNINPLSYTDNGDGTVTDNNTGLIWQQEDDGITYNWYQASGIYDVRWNPDIQDVCGSLDLGGFSDWRLPTKKELISIVDYNIPYPGPTIDSTYFPNTKSSYYWSSTIWPAGPEYTWTTHFKGGDTRLHDHDTIYDCLYVRCVRGKEIDAPNFVDNGDGTVTDNITGLMWQQQEPGNMFWDIALSYCEGLSLGGYSDWRLPNIRELQSITDDTKLNPAINTDYFPNTKSSESGILDNYWSSTSFAVAPSCGWYLRFSNGSIIYDNEKEHAYYVRCARGISATNAFTLTVIANPEDGGTIASTPAGLSCSGNTCQRSFGEGSAVTLTANPNGGWKFDYWDDGTTCYFQNPLTVTMDGDKTITAYFSWNEKILLKAADATPLGSRTPLILVHGNNLETDKWLGWREYLRKFRDDRSFQQRYKVYLLSWDSEQSNAYNGLAMGYLIDSLLELNNKDITVLAHSRGGIIARYFMNQYTMKRGNRESQLGGEKVKWLVTLATPHRGSPGADPIWVAISFDFNFLDQIELSLSSIYFAEPLLPIFPRLYDPVSYQQLLWDDVDNQLTNEPVCYNPALFNETEQCTPLMSKTILNSLSSFNQDEQYPKKIIAYGGNNYSRNVNRRMMFMLSVPLLNLEPLLLALSNHERLNLATVLMERMPIIPPDHVRVPDNPKRPFKANDGMVPLTSALFLKPGASDLFRFNGNELDYNKTLLRLSFCQIAECNVVDRTIDHLGFLDDGKFISSIIWKLKNLQ